MERDLFRLTRLLEKTGQPDRQEFSQLLSQLAVPPDLCYLKDALNRTQTILEQHGDELDMLLQRVPLKTLGAGRMREIADKLLRHPEVQKCSEDDPVSAPMERPSAEAGHPLHGFCLDVCHFWANLFFRLPLGSDDSLVQSYDHLAGQLGVHVIAANARLEPDSYLALCQEWARRGKQIPREEGDSALRSRAANASRALRRLSDREFENALDILVNHAPPDRMALRLRSGLRVTLY
jgi:hypothetical protein